MMMVFSHKTVVFLIIFMAANIRCSRGNMQTRLSAISRRSDRPMLMADNSIDAGGSIPAHFVRERSLQFQLGIGSPAKDYLIEVEFIEADCLLIGDQIMDLPAPKYIPRESTSYKNLSRPYSDRWYGRGQMASDMFRFSNGWQAKPFVQLRQQFAMMERMHRRFSFDDQVSGIIGLRLFRHADNRTSQSFMENLANIFGDTTILSFWFQSTAGQEIMPDNLNSTITIAGTDVENCREAEWKYTKSPMPNEWRVILDRIDIVDNRHQHMRRAWTSTTTNRSLPLNTTAIFEPGKLSFSLGPARQLQELASMLGSTGRLGGRFHGIPCNSTARLHFVSADGTFEQTLDAEEYIVPSSYFEKCILSFFDWEGDEWVFGVRFFSKRCLQLKYDRNATFVGFTGTVKK